MGSRILVYYRFWVVYFFVLIALIGSGTAYALSTPFWLLGFIIPGARVIGGRILTLAIRFLLFAQPWLKADVQWDKIPPGLTVSNHRSHLDAFYVLSRVPNLRLVCKRSLFFIPGLNFIMVMMRQIGIRRGSLQSYMKAMETVRSALRQGDSVHIFPEMTRCDFGGATQDFHLAPFAIALQEKTPITPIVFVDTDRVWRKGKLAISFREPIQVKTLPPIDSSRFTQAQTLSDEVKNRINQYLAHAKRVPAVETIPLAEAARP